MTVDIKKLNVALGALEEAGIFNRESITSAEEAFAYHQTEDQLLSYVLRSVFARIRSVDNHRVVLNIPITSENDLEALTGEIRSDYPNTYIPGIQYTSMDQGQRILNIVKDVLEATGYEVTSETAYKVDALDASFTTRLSEKVPVLRIAFGNPKENKLNEESAASKASVAFNDYE